MAQHVLLLLLTCGIWLYIWIYRTTGYLNRLEDEEPQNPTTKLLLCMFVPFCFIYWIYKNAQRLDKLAAQNGIASDRYGAAAAQPPRGRRHRRSGGTEGL